MELDNVLKKLRKLQKLYEGAKAINSEGEAANAAALIKKLLAEYNLTIDEVGTEEQKKENEKIENEIFSGYTHHSIGGQWEYRLWYVLCKWNFCKCFMYGNSYKRLIMFGSKANIEIVKWMFEVLSERFVEFSVERWKKYRLTEEYAMQIHKCSKDRFQRGYLQGAVEGLDAKLTEINKRDKQVEPEFDAKVTALAVRSNTAIDQYITDNYGWGKSRRTTNANRAGNYSGRRQGYSDGYNTDIHKPIQNNRHTAASGVNLLT